MGQIFFNVPPFANNGDSIRLFYETKANNIAAEYTWDAPGRPLPLISERLWKVWAWTKALTLNVTRREERWPKKSCHRSLCWSKKLLKNLCDAVKTRNAGSIPPAHIDRIGKRFAGFDATERV